MQAKTTDNPDGNLYLALENLIKKYEAKTAPNSIELEAQFIHSKLTNDEDDPDEWITNLEALQACMTEVILEGKLRSLILIWYFIFWQMFQNHTKTK